MGTPELLLLVLVFLALLLAFGILFGGAYFIKAAGQRRRTDDVSIELAGRDQWTASTKAGRAVITKVVDDRGWAYEIETSFARRRGLDRGDMVRLHYVAPSMAIARRTLRELADRHIAGEPQSGKTPAEIDRETGSRF